MKNIHIIQTSQPSTLIKDIWKNTFSLVEDFDINHTDFKAQHIYITSDEEIKEGDWFYNPATKEALYASKEMLSWNCDTTQEHKGWKKIILTTDQDLIKDGVQAIDDEFLEWFVKNPSCESVKVELDEVSFVVTDNIYKIIIPKEEQKQHLIDMMKADEELGLYDEPKTKCYCGHTTYCDCGQEEPKQETLEEAAEKYWSKQPYNEDAFRAGAKWQQERICDSEVIQKIRYSKSDAEARRIIRTI